MKKLPLVIGLVIALMFALTTLGLAQSVNACRSNRNGDLRYVSDASQCTKSETFMSWDLAGPQGPPGPPYAAVHDQLRNVGIMFGQLAFMNSFPADAFNALHCTAGSGAISVTLNQVNYVGTAFIGRDEISSPHGYHAGFKSNTAVDPNTLLGIQAVVNITSGGLQATFTGIVGKAGLVAVESGVYTYALVITAPIGILGETSRYRIWRNKTVPDIVKQALQESGISAFLFQLIKQYPIREFIMQYDETNLNFVSRLLEEEGIHYYFDNNAGKIVLSDSGLSNGILSGTPQYKGHLIGPTGSEAVVTGLYAAKGRPNASFSVDSYNFETPDLNLLMTVTADGVGDVYEFAQGVLDPNTSLGRATLIRNRSVVSANQLTGTGNSPSFRAGQRVNIQDTSGGTFTGTYLLTRVDHVAVYDAQNQCVTYANHFEATSQVQIYTPPRKTPVPKVGGVTTATVVGPAGATQWVDKHGRIKVQFHWDLEGQFDENSSAWVRVMIPAGKLEDTSLYIPLMGTEVVVGFLQGDPSLPIVVGSVYNGTHMPPVALP